MGVRLGADPKTLASIINTSSGRCWSSDTYNPVPGVMEVRGSGHVAVAVAPRADDSPGSPSQGVPSSRDYEGGFGSALMLKDLGLARDAAESVGAPLHTGKAAVDLYTTMVDQGYVCAPMVVGVSARHLLTSRAHPPCDSRVLCARYADGVGTRYAKKDFSSAYKYMQETSKDE